MDDQDSADYHNFTQPLPSTHRLPTLNGTSALFDAIERSKPISTSLENLDSVLSANNATISASGGISRGVVTEVYGPPGCGKTQLGLKLAANVLLQEPSAEVVWIDTSSTVPLSRLEDFISLVEDGETVSNDPAGDTQCKEQILNRFDHLQLPDLTRLLGLLIQPPQQFLTTNTRLLVVDNLSNAVMTGLPQGELPTTVTSTASNKLSREDILSRSVANRRAVMLGAISAGLSRLAASSNISVVVLNKATSGRRSGDRNAVLRSMLNTPQWNESIATRMVVYRDFWPVADHSSSLINSSQSDNWRNYPLRIAEVEKLDGRDINSRGVKFVILKHKLQAVEVKVDIGTTHVVTLPESSPAPEETNEEAMGNLDIVDVEDALDESLKMPEDNPATSSPVPVMPHSAKRKIDEIADSEDEEDDLLVESQPEARITNARGGEFTRSKSITNGIEDDELLLK